MRGPPRDSSALLTSAHVICFQLSIPGYREKRKMSTGIPSPALRHTLMLLITPLQTGSVWKFGHPTASLGTSKVLFGNNKSQWSSLG